MPAEPGADNYGFPDPVVIKPERECRLDDPRPIIDLIGLQDPIKENPFKVVGVVDATANFKQYKLHWGEGENPTEWHALQQDWITTPMRSAGVLAEWDVSELDGKVITLRVTMHSTQNTEVTEKVHALLHAAHANSFANPNGYTDPAAD